MKQQMMKPIQMKRNIPMDDKMKKIFDTIESDLQEAETKMKKSIDTPLQADVLKTIKAMGYEKLKSLYQ